MKGNHLAAIDLGTNSFHLVVVRHDGPGKFEIVTAEKEAVRLGSGGGDLDIITPEARARGIVALDRFLKIAQSYNAPVRAVATSALREARNRSEFLNEARERLQLEIEIIPGHEEARLIYLGILQGMPLFEKRILTVDIGGGSTEFVIGENGKPDLAVSLKLGAIRLNDRFFKSESLRSEKIKDCRRYVRVKLGQLKQKVKKREFDIAVGSSGTTETLYDMVLGADKHNPRDKLSLDDPVLNRSALQAITKKILSIKTSAERVHLAGLDEKRADIIVGGAILLEEIFRAFQIEEMRISKFALREGVVADTMQRAQANPNALIPDIRSRSVYHMTDRLLGKNSIRHRSATHCAFLAGRLYDRLLVHDLLPEGMGLAESKLLEAAALLHNVGATIAHSAQHKHSYYIIKNTDKLLGFNRLEVEIIAQTARYHRKSLPSNKHESFVELPLKVQQTISILSGILRIAVGLERRRQAMVQDIDVEQNEKELIIILTPTKTGDGSPADIDLELWAAQGRTDLLGLSLSLTIHFKLQLDQDP